MLKKFLSLFLVLSLLSSPAIASDKNGIKEALDELQYALTVEWDQEDKEFYQEQVNVFHSRLAEMKVSKAEVLSTLKKHFKDERLAREVDDINTVILNSKMSQEEIQKIVLSRLSRIYSRGAQWSPDVAYALAGIAIFVVVIVAVFSDPLPKHSAGWFSCYHEDGSVGRVYGRTSEWSGFRPCP